MEQKVKKRGWIKNAAIIFLAVMLVLTFFSNTIMNASLPEVATYVVNSGMITARVRGTGVVEANELYEYKVRQTREVEYVYVRVGDIVQEGDVLFTLAGKESSELNAAEKQLEELELAYQREVLQLASYDYAREDRDIQLAKEAIEEAEAEQAENFVTDEEIESAKRAVSDAEFRVEHFTNQVEEIQAEINKLGVVGDVSTSLRELSRQMEEQRTKIREAQTELDSLRIQHGANYNALKTYLVNPGGLIYEEIRSQMNGRVYQNGKTYAQWRDFLTYYESAQPQPVGADEYPAEYAGFPEPGVLPVTTVMGLEGLMETQALAEGLTYTWQSRLGIYMEAQASIFMGSGNPQLEQMGEAYRVLTEAEKKITELNYTLSNMEAQYNEVLASDKTAEYAHLDNLLTQSKTNLKNAQRVLEEEEGKLAELNAKQTAWKAAGETIKALSRNLEDLLFSLAEKKKTDEVTKALADLNLGATYKRIEEQRALIAELEAEEQSSEYIAPVSGKVSMVGVTPGNMTEPDTVLIAIEDVNRGYSLKFTVSEEQAKRVTVGSKAEVSSYYWGPEIIATLASIKNDPDNPRERRILTFTIKGEVETGTSLSLTLGDKGQQYSTIVPKSAMRKDSNGDFVLLLQTKSSPLGERYVAERVDVRIIDEDETNCAVTGLQSWEYVITSANKPVEAGMYVRLS